LTTGKRVATRDKLKLTETESFGMRVFPGDGYKRTGWVGGGGGMVVLRSSVINCFGRGAGTGGRPALLRNGSLLVKKNYVYPGGGGFCFGLVY